MPYQVRYSKFARDGLARLDPSVARKVIKKIQRLGILAETMPHVAMKGAWKGAYRLKITPYRVIYRLNHDEKILFVEAIGHRKDIYES